VKDNTDMDSWFSAKPIIVGNLKVHLSRYRNVFQREYDTPPLNLSRGVGILFLVYRGTVKVVFGEVITSKGQRLITEFSDIE